jgi:hypothetical protein
MGGDIEMPQSVSVIRVVAAADQARAGEAFHSCCLNVSDQVDNVSSTALDRATDAIGGPVVRYTIPTHVFAVKNVRIHSDIHDMGKVRVVSRMEKRPPGTSPVLGICRT